MTGYIFWSVPGSLHIEVLDTCRVCKDGHKEGTHYISIHYTDKSITTNEKCSQQKTQYLITYLKLPFDPLMITLIH